MFLSEGKVEFDREKFGPPEIEPEELEYLEKIGGGCFGSVFRGKCRGQEVAIKKFFRQDLSEKAISDFKKEIEICMHVGGHPNVLLFMGACTVPGNLAMVMELMPKGNLEHMLHNPAFDLSLVRRLGMAKEVAKGMNWLHCSHPMIIHRDLKPSNLLVDSHGHVRVCDFGLSAIKPDEIAKLQDEDTIPGTPLWMAPEVLSGRPLDEKADVYAFGIVLWEIVTRQSPFPDQKNFHLFKRAICIDGLRPPIPPEISQTYPSLAALLEACWQNSPRLRPAFQEIIHLLDQLMVDCAILDPQEESARLMWKTHFLGQEFVDWNDFYPRFYELVGLSALAPTPPSSSSSESPASNVASNEILFGPDRQSDERKFFCLKNLLAQKSPLGMGTMMRDPPDVVTLESFGQFLGWFGPIQPLSNSSSSDVETPRKKSKKLGSSSSSSSSSKDILSRVTRLCKEEWFYGKTDQDTAEKILKGCMAGTYLIRLNTKMLGAYTLSKVNKEKKIVHQRIYYNSQEGCFRTTMGKNEEGKPLIVQGRPGRSLSYFLGKLADDLFLINPCKDAWPYKQIFARVKTSGVEGYLQE